MKRTYMLTLTELNHPLSDRQGHVVGTVEARGVAWREIIIHEYDRPEADACAIADSITYLESKIP